MSLFHWGKNKEEKEQQEAQKREEKIHLEQQMRELINEDENQKPIYEQIREAIETDGTLGAGFSLPKVKSPEGEELDYGALDGFLIYHGASTVKEEEIDALCNLIQEACIAQSMKHGEMPMGPAKELQAIAAFLRERSALSMIDTLMEKIRNEQLNTAPEALLKVGVQLAVSSVKSEPVKLGLAIISLFHTDEDQEIRKIVLTLGLCDEFTLFAVVVAASWPDGNQMIFGFAKRVNGWGKIHAVEHLEPENKEMREWFIENGCKNTVSNEYLGLACAQKGELAFVLDKEHISKEIFEGASTILLAMLDAGPVTNIKAYEQGNEAIREYKRHAKVYSEHSKGQRILARLEEMEETIN